MREPGNSTEARLQKALRARSRRWFVQMGLTLNEQKTRVCDGRRESFSFLRRMLRRYVRGR